jgi:hypothetical protein
MYNIIIKDVYTEGRRKEKITSTANVGPEQLMTGPLGPLYPGGSGGHAPPGKI